LKEILEDDAEGPSDWLGRHDRILSPLHGFSAIVPSSSIIISTFQVLNSNP
jgi:hypothetical protein